MTYGNTLRHALDFQANCHNLNNASIYLTVNLTNIREIQRKQGLPPLGEGSELMPLFEAEGL